MTRWAARAILAALAVLGCYGLSLIDYASDGTRFLWIEGYRTSLLELFAAGVACCAAIVITLAVVLTLAELAFGDAGN